MLMSRRLIRIATIGPSFDVLGELTADLALALDLNVSLAYTAQNVHFVFPPSYGPSTGTFGPSDNSTSVFLGVPRGTPDRLRTSRKAWPSPSAQR